MDNFKKLFKYYKSKKPPPDFSNVFNLHELQIRAEESIYCKKHHPLPHELESLRINFGVRKPSEWLIYTFESHPGLIIISNAFTNDGAMSWIKKCLQQFSESPYRTNLSNLGIDLEGKSWWSSIKGSLSRDEPTKLVSQLRWSTIGYHHNWDTKEYSEVDKSPIPNEVEFLCQLFLCGAGYPNSNFKAEAGIVNYYPPGTTLSPHTDYSEPNKEAPLLSFSFGRSGIFLIGSHNKETTPTPIFLHHGDVMIMSESSRLCYHAVPRIMSDEDIKNTAIHSCFNAFLSHWNNVMKELKANKSNEMVSALLTYDDLLAILNYIKEIRINFNVRQVHG